MVLACVGTAEARFSFSVVGMAVVSLFQFRVIGAANSSVVLEYVGSAESRKSVSVVGMATTTSSPFKFRIVGVTTSTGDTTTSADATISNVVGIATYRVDGLEFWRVDVVYTLFVGVRRVAVIALSFGFGIGGVGAFAPFNAGGVGAISDTGRVTAIFDTVWVAALTFSTAS